MTSMDKFFGKFLRVEDIDKEMDVVVKSVQPEVIGQEDGAKPKLIVLFNDLDKGLALNRVNADSLAEAAGTKEIEKWAGTKVVLFVDPSVMFAGKKVGGVRIKSPPADEVGDF